MDTNITEQNALELKVLVMNNKIFNQLNIQEPLARPFARVIETECSFWFLSKTGDTLVRTRYINMTGWVSKSNATLKRSDLALAVGRKRN